MMLSSKASNKILVENLEVASSFWSRSKGLLGRETLLMNEGLWILKCRSVHTFFMKFPIDLIFLNKRMMVEKTLGSVKPGRLVLPVWGASSVIELSAGFLQKHPVQIGEELNVGSTIS